MICPKCKTQNSEDAIFCAHCGYKLKVVCPKCKMTNNLKAQRCTGCGLRLIRICPSCQAPNSPISEKCKKCDAQLLRKCKSCGALNALKATHCKKCAESMAEKPAEHTPHSTILVELTNADVINQSIEKQDVAEKLLKKFFQAILTAFKPYDIKALKLAPFAIGGQLSEINDAKMTAVAEKLLKEFRFLNEKLANVGICYDVKILVSQALSRRHKFGMDMLPKVKSGALYLDAASAMALSHSHQLQNIEPGIYAATKLPPITQVAPAPQVQETITQVAPEPVEEIYFEEEPVQQIDEQPALQSLEATAVEIPLQETVEVEPTPATTPQAEAQQAAPRPEAKPEIPQQPEQQAPPKETKPNERNLHAEKIKKLLTTKKGGFISLAGEPGIGKKTIFNFAMSEIKDQNFCLLQADCHQSINTTAYPTLQNLVRSMFSLPLINFGADQMQAKVKNALINSLQISDEKVIHSILNLIVPKASDTNIDEAKGELIFAIKELFKAVKKFQKIILIIKEIEFMDRQSADVFDKLVDDGFLEDAFFVTTTSEHSHISEFMHSPKLAPSNLGTIKMTPLTPDETIEELGYYIINTEEIPQAILEQIKTKTQGSPLFLEEIVVFLSQAGLVKSSPEGVRAKPEIAELILPDRIEELIAVRLESIFAQNEVIYQMVLNSVCLGYTFFPPVIQRVLGLDDSTFGMLLNILMTTGFLITHDNVNFKFKNKFIYEVIKNFVVKNEEQERQINANLLTVMLDMNESNSSQTGEIALKAQNYQQAFTLWSLAAQEAISTGDKALFLRAQKESLATIDFSDYPDTELRKLRLQEHLGKTSYLSDPEEALNALSPAIQYYEEQKDAAKIIELSSYIVKTLSILDNPQGGIEQIDKAIEYINPEIMPIEIALLKSLKLKFLIDSGYLGEAITLVQSDIMPSLQTGVKTEKNLSEEEQKTIQEAIVKSQIQLIKALSLQGNKNYYSVLELFVTNNKNEKAQAEIFVIDALHKTLNGMPEEALTSITKTQKILKGLDFKGQEEDRQKLLLDLDTTKILNKVIYEENYNVAQDVGYIAQKSKELNHTFAYNIIQILFVNQMVNDKNYAQAANMTDECLNYFASQKIALFAIPGWGVLSRIQAELGDYNQAISIAQQALDVASKPQIQNNYYITLMKKILGEYYAASGDFELAKMHFEQGIEFAKENDLLFMQGKLCLGLAKICAQNPQEPKENIAKLLDAAQTIATACESKFLQDKVEKAKTEITA